MEQGIIGKIRSDGMSLHRSVEECKMEERKGQERIQDICTRAFTSYITGSDAADGRDRDYIKQKLDHLATVKKTDKKDRQDYFRALLALVFLRDEDVYRYVRPVSTALKAPADRAMRIDYALDDEDGSEYPFQ